MLVWILQPKVVQEGASCTRGAADANPTQEGHRHQQYILHTDGLSSRHHSGLASRLAHVHTASHPHYKMAPVPNTHSLRAKAVGNSGMEADVRDRSDALDMTA